MSSIEDAIQKYTDRLGVVDIPQSMFNEAVERIAALKQLLKGE